MALLNGVPLGTRVVVRYRLHGDTHRASDALGELVSRDAASCVVRTRAGDVTVALRDVLLAKEVPPPPAPREARRG
ncbi:hypothetical protein OVA14_05565 [Agrococcus sp. SL85]|uniref:putative acetyltransferase n=1 Tax=Agrococcus sp. SL85 TaxID=2995141 RepID=UPI00226C8C8C|nr:hypothetical protein [Agrococcus sp. SL85]WAC67209.1 hypothetical protein OVA14_05565 [Agrococcus sp. SL85]